MQHLINEVGNHFHYKEVKTTGFVFKLLTRITVNLLVASAVIISFRQFFG